MKYEPLLPITHEGAVSLFSMVAVSIPLKMGPWAESTEAQAGCFPSPLPANNPAHLQVFSPIQPLPLLNQLEKAYFSRKMILI